jgi:hypothetical protein
VDYVGKYLNQGPGGTPESQEHWRGYGVAYSVQTGKYGFFGNHAFGPFMKTNPMYQRDWEANPSDLAGGKRPLSGRNAPDPMDVIKQFHSSCDMTIGCHGQGCNITMAILNRACKK